MKVLVIGVWILLIADALVISVLSFFVVGRHLPDRGATPLAGSRMAFFSATHAQQLQDYRARCERSGRSLVPWAVVFYSARAWPWSLGLALVLTLLAVAR